MVINEYIDHTLVKPEATLKQIEQLCVEAMENHFMAVCVNPFFAKVAKNFLISSDVKICTVIGFPFGMTTIETKEFETEDAIKNGTDEIDMVMNIGAAKSAAWDYVYEDIFAIAKVVHDQGKLLKVIVETSLLTEEEKNIVCGVVIEAGADFIKNSTGFSGNSATTEDIKLIVKNCGGKIGIKASGRIRDYKTAKQFIELGATRIGTSAGTIIMNEEKGIRNKNQ